LLPQIFVDSKEVILNKTKRKIYRGSIGPKNINSFDR
jgi:hypothetical protein